MITRYNHIGAFGKTKTHAQGIIQSIAKDAFYERNTLSRKAIEENNLISQQEAKAYFVKKHSNKKTLTILKY